MASKRSTLKRAIEALLFVEELSAEEIAKKLRRKREEVEKAIEELKKEYEGRGIKLVEEGNKWKLEVASEFIPFIKKAKPELSSAVMKTLALIAWKQPVSLAYVAKVRGNRAYEHVRKLAEKGLIAAKEAGRTKVLRLSRRFHSYFKVSREKLTRLLRRVL